MGRYEVGIGGECAVAAGVVRQAGVLFARISVEQGSALRRRVAVAADAVAEAVGGRRDRNNSH